MNVEQNISLRPFNTFRIDAKAKYFAAFNNRDELSELVSEFESTPKLILGGGSNILFTNDFDGIVLNNCVRGIEQLHEDPEYVIVKAGAGENWHQFVQYCIDRNWAGLENLSLIPGNVGAAPMQNIGAYGVEQEDLFWDLEAFHLRDHARVTFTRDDCRFGYRESIFKNKFKNQFVILNVTFRLRKTPIFHTEYGAIQEELRQMGVKDLSIRAISQAVINIRSSKLPDPKEIGNAGSFFKNPVVNSDHYKKLKAAHPSIVGYETMGGSVKLAAGWLIEQCGPQESATWKGYRKGDAGVHARQALVLVNYDNAKGNEILELSKEIQTSVKKKFDVDLEREVNII